MKKFMILLMLFSLVGCQRSNVDDLIANDSPELDYFSPMQTFFAIGYNTLGREIRNTPLGDFGFYTYESDLVEVVFEVDVSNYYWVHRSLEVDDDGKEIVVEDGEIRETVELGLMILLDGIPQSFYLEDGTFIDKMYVEKLDNLGGEDDNLNLFLTTFRAFFKPSHGMTGDILDLEPIIVFEPNFDFSMYDVPVAGSELLYKGPSFLDVKTDVASKPTNVVEPTRIVERNAWESYASSLGAYNLAYSRLEIANSESSYITVKQGDPLTLDMRVTAMGPNERNYRIMLVEDGHNFIPLANNQNYIDVPLVDGVALYEVNLDTSKMKPGKYQYTIWSKEPCTNFTCKKYVELLNRSNIIQIEITN